MSTAPVVHHQPAQPHLEKVSCLLNWESTVYHAPLFLAQKLGYFAAEGLQVAILEPSDPSDVTALIAGGNCDLGLKAMIHTIAAKANGFNVTSVGTLLDEPETGIIALRSSGIKSLNDLRGKRVGYVGMFGKVIVDELMERFGYSRQDYEAVRVGMNVARELKKGTIDAGVGIESIQAVELEEWIKEKKSSRKEDGAEEEGVVFLRIDELAELGCCCFCSILHIVNDDFLSRHPDRVKAYLRAIKKAGEFVRQNPEKAYELYAEMKPKLDNPTNRKMFERCFDYLSPSMLNVQRDWNKVTNYCCRLGIVDQGFLQNQTNGFLPQASEDELALAEKQDEMRKEKARACRTCQ